MQEFWCKVNETPGKGGNIEAECIRKEPVTGRGFTKEDLDKIYKAGIKEVVEWIKTERKCKYIDDVTYYPVYEKALEAKLNEWGI